MQNNKKFELSSSYSQIVSLSSAILSQFILGVCAAAKDCKNQQKKPFFGSSASFKVIDVDTTEKLVTGACCDRQHAHVYQQPFSRKTDFYRVPLFDALECRFP